jgi:hypothetical protein
VDTPKFFGIPVTYSPARNAVRLYRVTYSSVIPERGNKPIVATSLLPLPETRSRRSSLNNTRDTRFTIVFLMRPTFAKRPQSNHQTAKLGGFYKNVHNALRGVRIASIVACGENALRVVPRTGHVGSKLDAAISLLRRELHRVRT